MGRTEQARVTTTKSSLKVLHTSVNMFKMDTGRYPTEDEGLLVLVEQPLDIENYPPEGYLDQTEVPLDGWGHEFIYQEYPESGKPFVIISLGADKDDGGEGENADLYSTDP
ncbi:MAG: type II secretion system protein GspG [Planctomycetes bacterium]|nr:type II secretion system protein GspG [Planctomycetota bacterium]